MAKTGNAFFDWYVNWNQPSRTFQDGEGTKAQVEARVEEIAADPTRFGPTGKLKPRFIDRFSVVTPDQEMVQRKKTEINNYKSLQEIKAKPDLVARAGRYGIEPETGMTVASLEQQINTKEKIAQAKGLIRRSGAAGEGIQAPTTLEEATSLIEELKPLAESELADRTGAGKRAIDAHKSGLKTDEQSRKSSAASIRASEEQISASQAATKLAALQTENKQALAEYELKANRYENDMRRNENNLDRASRAEEGAMRMELEYARLAQQDREDKQARKDKMMMMMLQGLGNMGAGFTI